MWWSLAAAAVEGVQLVVQHGLLRDRTLMSLRRFHFASAGIRPALAAVILEVLGRHSEGDQV